MKGLRFTKNFNEIKFEGVLGELESKVLSRDNNSQNINNDLQFPCEIAPNWKHLISTLISYKTQS